MFRKVRPFLLCAAGLMVLGALVWAYDAWRNHPTPRDDLSTQPSPLVVTRSVPATASADVPAPPAVETPPSPALAESVTPTLTPQLAIPLPEPVQPPLLSFPGIESPMTVNVPLAGPPSGGVRPMPDRAPVVEPQPVTTPSAASPPGANGDNPPAAIPLRAGLSSTPPDVREDTQLAPPPPLPTSESPPVAPTAAPEPKSAPCPWTFQIAVVNGRTQLEVRNGGEVQFTVGCDHLNMQCPSGQVCATGAVQVTGLNLEGTCEKLTLGWHDERVSLEGKVRLKCKQDGQDVDLAGEQLSVKLAVVEMLPPPVPLD